MQRALIRLRPDGIHEIVRPLARRKLAAALSALLVAGTSGLVAAAAFSAFFGTARSLLAGASLTAVALLALLLRARLRSATGPLAVPIPLRAARGRGGPLAPHAGGDARDAGA